MRRGSSTTKRAPRPPVASSIHTRPSIVRTCSATSASPRPVPPTVPRWPDPRPRKNRSKMRRRSSCGIPRPAIFDLHADDAVDLACRDPSDALSVRPGVLHEVGEDAVESPLVSQHGVVHERGIDLHHERRSPQTRRPNGARAPRSGSVRARVGRRRRRARASSSSSPTRRWKLRTSATTRSNGSRIRSGTSARRASTRSVAATSVVKGERSSWLTSDANLVSRSMRCWRAETMWLNDAARGARSGSCPISMRRDSCPPAMSPAAVLTSASGRNTRRPAHSPRRPAATVVAAAAASNEFRMTPSVWSSSSSEKTSKYCVSTAAIGTPTARKGSPEIETRWCARLTAADDRTQPSGEVLAPDRDRGPEPALPAAHDHARAGRQVERFERRGHIGVGSAQAVAQQPRVQVGLSRRRLLTLANEIAVGQPVRDDGEDRRQDQATEREGGDDARSKTSTSPQGLRIRYPRPRTVAMRSGSDASRSTFVRRRRMWASTRRPSPR